MKLKHILLTGLAAIAVMTVASCEKKGPAEKAGEKVDEAAEDVKDKVEEAGDEIEEATDK